MKTFVILLSALFLTVATYIPSFFDKCDSQEEEISKCFRESANKGWPEFVKAYKLRNIPFIDVYKIFPNLGHANITGVLKGFEDIKFENIYSNLRDKSFDVIYSQPILSMETAYNGKASFLGFTIEDYGQANLTYSNGTYKYHFNYEIEQRNGEEFIILTTYDLTFNIEKLYVDMTCINNPDMCEMMKSLYNNHWQLLNMLSANTMAEIFSETYTPIIRDYLKTTTLKSLLGYSNNTIS